MKCTEKIKIGYLESGYTCDGEMVEVGEVEKITWSIRKSHIGEAVDGFKGFGMLRQCKSCKTCKIV